MSVGRIGVDDYVRVKGRSEVWTVVAVRGDRATLSPSSIGLAGAGRRVAKLVALDLVEAEVDEF